MPLSMMGIGEKSIIKKVGGKEETKRFLENLGFVIGGTVTVVSSIGGSIIVNVKDTRVAIGKDKGKEFYHDIKGSKSRKYCSGEKTEWPRSSKKTNHGYGDNKRCNSLY